LQYASSIIDRAGAVPLPLGTLVVRGRRTGGRSWRRVQEGPAGARLCGSDSEEDAKRQTGQSRTVRRGRLAEAADSQRGDGRDWWSAGSGADALRRLGEEGTRVGFLIDIDRYSSPFPSLSDTVFSIPVVSITWPFPALL
ncbi:hypothetical protein PFISCL1PPCAC_18390, partial [Pristionchus fissidentatus]